MSGAGPSDQLQDSVLLWPWPFQPQLTEVEADPAVLVTVTVYPPGEVYVFDTEFPEVLVTPKLQFSGSDPVAVKVQVAPEQDLWVIDGAVPELALTVTASLTLLVWFPLSVTVSVTV